MGEGSVELSPRSDWINIRFDTDKPRKKIRPRGVRRKSGLIVNYGDCRATIFPLSLFPATNSGHIPMKSHKFSGLKVMRISEKWMKKKEDTNSFSFHYHKSCASWMVEKASNHHLRCSAIQHFFSIVSLHGALLTSRNKQWNMFGGWWYIAG